MRQFDCVPRNLNREAAKLLIQINSLAAFLLNEF
jgi:hypothetical protein